MAAIATWGKAIPFILIKAKDKVMEFTVKAMIIQSQRLKKKNKKKEIPKPTAIKPNCFRVSGPIIRSSVSMN